MVLRTETKTGVSFIGHGLTYLLSYFHTAALTIQRLRSASDLHVQNAVLNSAATEPISQGFAIPAPLFLQSPKRTIPCNNGWSETGQFTRTAFCRTSSAGGASASLSRPEAPQQPSNSESMLMNAAAIGLLSPQLVRSPVLRGG